MFDEWVVQALTQYDKKKLKSVAHGEVDLGDAPADDAKQAEIGAAITAVKRALGDRVKDVRASRRLTDSASVLVAAEGDLGANMERILKMTGQGGVQAKRILELNPDHAAVKNLAAVAAREPESARVAAWSELLFDQALLAEGVVEEPAKLVKRIQDLLVEVSSAALG